MRYEYKLIPAPAEAPKVKGLKGATARYVHGLEGVLNAMGASGWDYVRCDRMHVTASRGWLRRPEERDETLLVFRRERSAPGADHAPPAELEREAPDPEDEIPDYMRPRSEPAGARRVEPAPESPVFSRRPLAARRD